MSKNILAIGAGAGIGLAVARLFHAQGYGVGLVARNLERAGRCADAEGPRQITAALPDAVSQR